VLANLRRVRRALRDRPDEGLLLEEALEGAERIARIVADVKSFSRPYDDDNKVLDVRTVIETAISLVDAEIRPRAWLERNYRETAPVLANDGRLGQVFVNLLINAVQAIPEGDPGTNRIRVATSPSDGDRVTIEISDTGCGIPAELRTRIFEPFFTTKRVGVGTGLGLSISHGIVKSLGGEITVDSEVGRGTTFRVVLPSASHRLEAAMGRRSMRPKGRWRVLVIDHDPRLSLTVADMLGPSHDVATAIDGDAALERLLADEPFDFILCELDADESALAWYDSLRATRPEIANRVAFMTSGSLSPRAREFVRAVGDRCLTTPFEPAALLDIIAKMSPSGLPAQP
jgi:CheY-like chemotaxis protein